MSLRPQRYTFRSGQFWPDAGGAPVSLDSMLITPQLGNAKLYFPDAGADRLGVYVSAHYLQNPECLDSLIAFARSPETKALHEQTRSFLTNIRGRL